MYIAEVITQHGERVALRVKSIEGGSKVESAYDSPPYFIIYKNRPYLAFSTNVGLMYDKDKRAKRCAVMEYNVHTKTYKYVSDGGDWNWTYYVLLDSNIDPGDDEDLQLLIPKCKRIRYEIVKTFFLCWAKVRKQEEDIVLGKVPLEIIHLIAGYIK